MTSSWPHSSPLRKYNLHDPNCPPTRLTVIDGTLQSPMGWEALLVDAAVIGGADRWERRLRGLESELRLQLSELDENSAARLRLTGQIGRLTNLEQFALPLIHRLHALPSSADWGAWLDALSDLARAALRRPEPVLSS